MPSSRRHVVVTATGARHKVQGTKTEQAAEIIAFADYWNNATGSDPGLVVFDSQLTTCRSSTSSPAAASTGSPCVSAARTSSPAWVPCPHRRWKTAAVDRAGRYRRPQLHEDMVKLTDVSAKVREIAIKNIGRDEPTLLITHYLATPAQDLFARYAERWTPTGFVDTIRSGTMVYEERTGSGTGSQEVHPGI